MLALSVKTDPKNNLLQNRLPPCKLFILHATCLATQHTAYDNIIGNMFVVKWGKGWIICRLTEDTSHRVSSIPQDLRLSRL